MSKLDLALARLNEDCGNMSMPDLSAPVLAGFALLRERQASRRGMVLASAVALVVGSASALLPTRPAMAEPLLGIPASAPSSLLIN